MINGSEYGRDQRPVIYLQSHGRDYQGTATLHLTNPGDGPITLDLRIATHNGAPATFQIQPTVTITGHGSLDVPITADVHPWINSVVNGTLSIQDHRYWAYAYPHPLEIEMSAMRPPLPPKRMELVRVTPRG